MASNAKRFNERVKEAVELHVGQNGLDPGTAELILQHHAQLIRHEYGTPAVTADDIEWNHDFGVFGED